MFTGNSRSGGFERADAFDTGHPAVMSQMTQKEDASATGVYDAVCYIPRAQDLASYIKTRDMIQEIKSGGWFSRVTHARKLNYLEQKFDEFELEVMWTDRAKNVVTTVGKNLALDSYLAGSSYTVVGPYMGLISSTSWSAVSASDTMSSHAGWLEAGNANAPTYTSPRKTAAWSSASSGSKALSSALSFAMTGTGTVKGCFLVFGSGAVSTIDNTSGTLYSAGLFTGGDQPVVNGNTLSVSYTAAL
jgi:hypothetical protein